MERNDLVTYVNANKGVEVIVTKADTTEVRGYVLSVNSKGLNLKDDDNATISIAASRVETIRMAEDELETFPADDFEDAQDRLDDAILNQPEDDELTGDEISDLIDAGELDPMDDDEAGHTTAELAELFNTSAKALRVHLRAMGMGVGQGRRYYLDDAQLATVKAHFES